MSFQELSKAFNGNVNGIISEAGWNKSFSGNGNQFMIAQSFEAVDSLLSGDTNIATQHSNIELSLIASRNPLPTTVISFIHIDAFVVIDGSGLRLVK